MNGEVQHNTDDISVRPITVPDLSVMVGWWEYWRKGEDVPIEALSTSGVVVEINGSPAAMGFLYYTNSNRCFSDYCIVDPSLGKKDRNRAIDILMDALIGLSSSKGFAIMEIVVREYDKKLFERCKEKGFIELGNVSYMGRLLCRVS